MAKLRTIAANKEWLSLKEAAKELSHSLDEEVNEEDLWRFAYEEKLILSLWLENFEEAYRYDTYQIFNDKIYFLYFLEHGLVKLSKDTPPITLKNFNEFWEAYRKEDELAFSYAKHLMQTFFFFKKDKELLQKLLRIAGFEAPDIIDGDVHEDTWLNKAERIPIDGVIDFLPTGRYKNDLIKKLSASVGGKGRYYSTVQPTFITQYGDTYELLETVLDSNNSGKLIYQRITTESVFDFAPVVIRPENLQTCLDTLLPESVLEPEANTSPSTESKKQPAWNYRKPKSENEINMTIYNALVVAHKQGVPNPKNLTSLVPIINKQGALGECQVKGGNVYFHLEKDKSIRFSRTTKSIKNTINDLLKA